MRHKGLLKTIAEVPQLKEFLKEVKYENSQQIIYGVSGSQASLTEALVLFVSTNPLLVITPDESAGQRAATELASFCGEELVKYFPPREILPLEVEARSLELVAQRLSVIQGLYSGKLRCVVATVESMVQRILPPEVWEEGLITLRVGQVTDREVLITKLIFQGYEREELVEAPGQMAVRGGVLDVFPLAEKHPVRLDFFGDEIQSIRFFNVQTQRSERVLKEILIIPAKEVLITEAAKKKGYHSCKRELEKTAQSIRKNGRVEVAARLEARINLLLDKLSGGGPVAAGLEQVLHLFYSRAVTILDYFASKPIIFLEEPLRLQENLTAKENIRSETFAQLLEDGAALPSQIKNDLTFTELVKRLRTCPIVSSMVFPRKIFWMEPQRVTGIETKSMPSIIGKIPILVKEINYWKKEGYLIILFTSQKERAELLKETLWDSGVEAVVIPELNQTLETGQVVITLGELQKGFEFPRWKVIVISDVEWERGRKKPRRRFSKKGVKVTDFSDFRKGDYVVHVQHGIGRYAGIERLNVGGINKDYMLIEYAGEDRLYIPTEQVELVQKYVAAEGHVPRLNKLGGNEWKRTKNRVKQSVQVMAQELLELYASRRALEGYAFSPDTSWQQAFEALFPYQETTDQIQAIEDVKADMESPKVMDRLLCGDVGYGKTEVALRAAFKAVMDSKQVAVLVPTTILAEQHYNTFKERCENFPVRVEALSRFRTPREQAEIIAGIKNGEVDIVIGTHRLLSEDIRFKDQGLLIVDEEQRFGVVHKEKMKKMKKNVDVLTLTATPIPRTLQMSLVGVRDMSVIETPPEDRFPVQTYVLEFSTHLIREVIQRELAREGQVYYVHNRIADIDQQARLIRQLVPEARVVIGHGQMAEDELEKVMLDFIEGRYDVLVCTTIVENGLDIANVNTLIVDEADQMGLSQLYQLRGRVGRSNRLARAYFTYRKDKVLSEIAEKRLAAIRDFTEFGSGFKIAMRDLEIRGAGNLLGSEQHGHMLAIGFDLYCRMLEEAVRELKVKHGFKTTKSRFKETEEPQLVFDLHVDAYIGDDYIEETGLKMEVYQRLKEACTLHDIKELQEELVDRYGSNPPALKNLFQLARIRLLALSVKARSVEQKQDKVLLALGSNPHLQGEKLMRLAQKFPRRLSFSVAGGLTIGIRTSGCDQKEMLTLLENILIKMVSLAEEETG